MNKLSAEDQHAVLAEVPGVLRKLAAERDYFKGELLKRAGRDRIEKIAAAMVDKGLRSGTVAEVADNLAKEAAAGELDVEVTERAVEMVGPNMGHKHAHISDEYSGAAGSALERFLVS